MNILNVFSYICVLEISCVLKEWKDDGIFNLVFLKSVVLHLYEECQIKRCNMYHQALCVFSTRYCIQDGIMRLKQDRFLMFSFLKKLYSSTERRQVWMMEQNLGDRYWFHTIPLFSYGPIHKKIGMTLSLSNIPAIH